MSQSKLKCPLQLFPKEIWELIFDQIHDSRLIQATLRGLPELKDNSTDKRKRFWLIDQVFPFLIKMLNGQEMLALRKICKQWQVRIDFALQTQLVLYQAYSHELHKDIVDFWKVYQTGKGVMSHMFLTSNKEGDKALMAEVMSHPRNPFVFRSLQLNFKQDSKPEATKEFVTLVLEFLNKFGIYLWHLTISAPSSEDAGNVPSVINENILKLLGHLPNLKSFCLEEEEEEENDDDEAGPRLSKPIKHCCIDDVLPTKPLRFPELLFLETFTMTGEPAVLTEGILYAFLLHYGPQLRKLTTSLKHWDWMPLELFSSLTELLFDDEENSTDSVQLQLTLSLIDCPNLVRLDLLIFDSKKFYFSIDEDIFKWLKRFPRIKYFSIVFNSRRNKIYLIEEGKVNPEEDLIPSLQTLQISDEFRFTYNFLRCFPSLRHLEIHYEFHPVVMDFSMPEEYVQLREQIQTGKVYESNIWKLLPQLRTVFLVPNEDLYGDEDEGCREYQFSRETYEKLNKAGSILSVPGFHPFREDIQFYLNGLGEERDDEESESSSDESFENDLEFEEQREVE